MATSAGANAAVLPADLRFSAGGLRVEDLIGTFIKEINFTTGVVTYQQADGTEATGTIVTSGGLTTEQVRDIIGSTLVGGTNVTITVDDANDTVTITAAGGGTSGLDAEQVRDLMGTVLTAGANVTITPDDANDTITIAATGGGGSGLDAEGVRDTIGTALQGGTNVTVDVDDANNTITVNGLANTTMQELARDTIGASLTEGTNISIDVNDAANTITISAAGSGLTTEAVRDLIGTTIVGGTNVTVDVDDANNTVTINSTATGTSGLDAEEVRDLMGTVLTAGANVTITPDDAANTITISATGGGGSGLDAEQVRDLIGTTLTAGANVTITPDDANDTVTISATGGGGGLTAEQVRDTIGTALTEGANIDITVDDTNDTITIAVTGLATVATSGQYSDLSGTPTILTAEQVRDLIGTVLTAGANVTITPDDAADTVTVAVSGLATVATTGSYSDLTGTPTLATGSYTSQETWEENSRSAPRSWGWDLGNGRDGVDYGLVVPSDCTVTAVGVNFNVDTAAINTYEVGLFIDPSSNYDGTSSGEQPDATVVTTTPATNVSQITESLELDEPLSLSAGDRLQVDVINSWSGANPTTTTPGTGGANLNGTITVEFTRPIQVSGTGTGLDAEQVRDLIGTTLTAGTNITITPDDSADTVTVAVSGLATVATTGSYSDLTGTPTILTAEQVRDLMGTVLTAGANVTITPDDANDTITIAATGGGTSGLNAEEVRDTIGTALTEGANIDITVDDTNDTITIAVTGLATVATTGSYSDLTGTPTVYTLEEIRDEVAGMFREGANITIAIDDANNTITISGAAGGNTGLTAEQVRDTIGTALTEGANIDITVDDTNDTITIAVTGLATVATTGSYSDLSGTPTVLTAEEVRDLVGTLLVAGANVTITPDDDNDTVTIAATGGGGGGLTEEQVRDLMGTTLTAGDGITVTPDDAADTVTIAATTRSATYVSQETWEESPTSAPRGWAFNMGNGRDGVDGGLVVTSDCTVSKVGVNLILGSAGRSTYEVGIFVNNSANYNSSSNPPDASAITTTPATNVSQVTESVVLDPPLELTAGDRIQVDVINSWSGGSPDTTSPSTAGQNTSGTITVEFERPLTVGGVGNTGTGLTEEQVRDLIGSTLAAGSGITVTVDDAADTVTIAATGGGGGLTEEQVRDLMGTTLTAGTNITITPDDSADTVTVAVSGLATVANSGSFNDLSNRPTILTAEQVRDLVGTLLVAGANVTITPDDANDTITIAATGGGGGLTEEQVRDLMGTVLTAGANVTITPDDANDTITIAATGGGGSATDLSVTRNSVQVTVQSSTGTNATINSASTSNAGVMSASAKSKLDGIQELAERNPTDAEIGAKAFRNVPGDLSSSEAGTVRVRTGLTNAFIGTTAFTTPPSTLTDTQKQAVRTAIDAAAAGEGGTSLTAEEVRDLIGTALTEGANIDITVDDTNDTITIAVTGVQPWALTGGDAIPLSAIAGDRADNVTTRFAWIGTATTVSAATLLGGVSGTTGSRTVIPDPTGGGDQQRYAVWVAGDAADVRNITIGPLSLFEDDLTRANAIALTVDGEAGNYWVPTDLQATGAYAGQPYVATLNAEGLDQHIEHVIADNTDQADLTETDNTKPSFVRGKSTLFSGDYNDLTNRPTIPGAEFVRDTMGTALVGGTNVTITPNDAADTITIAAADGGLDAEAVRDTAAAMLQAGTGISLNKNDAADTVTISATAAGTTAITVESYAVESWRYFGSVNPGSEDPNDSNAWTSGSSVAGFIAPRAGKIARIGAELLMITQPVDGAEVGGRLEVAVGTSTAHFDIDGISAATGNIKSGAGALSSELTFAEGDKITVRMIAQWRTANGYSGNLQSDISLAGANVTLLFEWTDTYTIQAAAASAPVGYWWMQGQGERWPDVTQTLPYNATRGTNRRCRLRWGQTTPREDYNNFASRVSNNIWVSTANISSNIDDPSPGSTFQVFTLPAGRYDIGATIVFGDEQANYDLDLALREVTAGTDDRLLQQNFGRQFGPSNISTVDMEIRDLVLDGTEQLYFDCLVDSTESRRFGGYMSITKKA